MAWRSTSMVVGLTLLVGCGISTEDSPTATSAVEVPEALALALVGNTSDETRLFVGALPPALAEDAPIPFDLPLVGGLIGEDGGTLIFETSESAHATLLAFGRGIEDEGWEDTQEWFGPQGGFVQNPRPVAGMWCGEDHYLRATVASVLNSEFLRVRFYELRPGRNPCEDARRREQQMRMSHDALALPSLESPEGAEVQMTGGGGSTDSRSMDAMIVTDLDGSELFDYYRRQLERAGWESGAETSRGALALGQWEAQDDQGEPTIGILAVWPLPQADSYRAMLRMERPRRDD